MPKTKQLLGVDYAYGRPRPKHLRDAGFLLACRYLSNDVGKNLDADERDALLHAGEDIVVVWESTAGRALEGGAAGREDAHRAIAQLHKLRGPKGMAVYFAVDTGTTGKSVALYFRAARKVVLEAGYSIGGYGSYAVVNYLHREGLIDFAWQTVAWSFGKVSKHADLYQRAQTRKIDGVTVDVDVICHSNNYGGWQSFLPPSHEAKKQHEHKRKAAAKKTPKEPAVNVKRYSKSILALIGGIGTWATAALADGVISGPEWSGLGVAIAVALGVWSVPNQQRKTSSDAGLTAAGVLLVALIVLLALALGLGVHPLLFLLVLPVLVVPVL